MSTAETIARYYGGNHYLACGRLMKALAEHGVTGDMSSYFYREGGYFDIKDEKTGQVYVGINVYCNAEKDQEKRGVVDGVLPGTDATTRSQCRKARRTRS